MENAWRVPFARFLKDTAIVEDGKSRFYLYWVGRWLSSAEPGEEAPGPPTHLKQRVPARSRQPPMQQNPRHGIY